MKIIPLLLSIFSVFTALASPGDTARPGWQHRYHPNGQLSWQAHIAPGAVYPDTTYEWYDNGVVATVDIVRAAYRAGLHPNGKLKNQKTGFIDVGYDSLGNITHEYIREVSIGQAFRDYATVMEADTLMHMGSFTNGLRDGRWRAFYNNDTNKVCYDVTYKNGMLNGPAHVYGRNRKLMLLCNYSNGLWNGPLLRRNNGHTVDSGTYDKGRQVGIWYGYYPDGRLRTIERYDPDHKTRPYVQLINYMLEPGENSTTRYYKSETRTYIDDNNYSETRYHDNGQKSDEDIVKNGKRTIRQYDRSGKLISSNTYDIIVEEPR